MYSPCRSGSGSRQNRGRQTKRRRFHAVKGASQAAGDIGSFLEVHTS